MWKSPNARNPRTPEKIFNKNNKIKPNTQKKKDKEQILRTYKTARDTKIQQECCQIN